MKNSPCLCRNKDKNYIGFFLQKSCKQEEWSEIFKVLKEKTHQPRILYPAKLSFKSENEILS